jgi:hypothetical protein
VAAAAIVVVHIGVFFVVVSWALRLAMTMAADRERPAL